jgi:hypothetical phage protein (possible glycine amidinotransferase)
MVINEYSKLTEVIVGRDFDFSPVYFDSTFKLFFKANLDHYDDLDLSKCFESQYTAEILANRNEDLDSLAKLLESFEITVYRPEKCEKIHQIKTPTFSSIVRSSSNVRDLTFVYGNNIIETAPSLKGRFFENFYLRKIFQKKFNDGFNWLSCPNNYLDFEIDPTYYKDFHISHQIDESQFTILGDAADAMRIDGEIIMNIGNANNLQFSKWLSRVLNKKIHNVFITDNHIDGNIASIAPETILVNDCMLENPIEFYLPDFMKSYKIIKIPKNSKHEYNTNFTNIASSEGMSINVLSISPKDIIINKDDISTLGELLYKNDFNLIPIQLRYCRAFGGGIHCSTLDLNRI